MGKRADKGDSTQPLSESQVVKVTPPRPPVGKNDQSIAWKGTVVSADEFRLPKAPGGGGGGKWLIAGVLGAGVIGAGVYTMWPTGKPAPASKVDAAGSAAPAIAGSAVAVPASAGSDAATPDAPPPIDAAAPVDAAAPEDAALDARPDAGKPAVKKSAIFKGGKKKPTAKPKAH